MTREQQIAAALAIITTRGADPDACRADIKKMLADIDDIMVEEGTLSNSRDTKAKAGRLHAALRELQAAHNALPERLKADVFQLPDLHEMVTRAKLFATASLKRPAERRRLAVLMEYA